MDITIVCRQSNNIMETQGTTYSMNPYHQVMDEEERNVAVAVSYGYGTGWSSSNGIDPTDARVVHAVLQGQTFTPIELTANFGSGSRVQGYQELHIERWPAGTWVRITEEDGAECCMASGAEDEEAYYLHPSAANQARMESEARRAASREKLRDRMERATRNLYEEALRGKGDIDLCFADASRDDHMVLTIHTSVARTIPYFRGLLYGGFVEQERRSSTLLEVSRPDLGGVLVRFMYLGDVTATLSPQDIQELTTLADMLGLVELVEYLSS